jgi:hypothetical protein
MLCSIKSSSTFKLESINLPVRNLNVEELLIEQSIEYSTLFKKSNILDGNTNISGKAFLEKVKQAFPNLQVSVPIHCEEWDTENYIPLVAFVPYDFQEQTHDSICAYDIYGNKHMLSSLDPPEDPVIVVSPSERIDRNAKRIGVGAEIMDLNIDTINSQSENNIIGRSMPSVPGDFTISSGSSRSVELEWSDVANETHYNIYRKHSPPEDQYWHFATTTQNQNYFINNWIQDGVIVSYRVTAENDEGESGYTPHKSIHVSARNDGELLKLEAIYFTFDALRAVERWHSGAPEIRLRIVIGTEIQIAHAIYTSGRIEPARRSYVEGQWWHLQEDLLRWYTSSLGSVWNFDWREEDWDDNTTFTISGGYEDKNDGATIKAGGSITFQNDEGKDHIGNTPVHYWDPKSNIYNISGFRFMFTQ